MKKIISLCVVLLLASCTKDKAVVSLQGKISNPLDSGKTTELIIINDIEFGSPAAFKKTIEVQANGTFSDTLKIPCGGIYTFMYSDYAVGSVYMEPNNNLELYFDNKNFEPSLEFKGEHAEASNYLKKTDKEDFELMNATFELFDPTKKDINNFLDSLNLAKSKGLETLKNVSPEFIDLMKNKTEISLLSTGYYLQGVLNEIDPKMAEKHKKHKDRVDSFNYDDEALYRQSRDLKEFMIQNFYALKEQSEKEQFVEKVAHFKSTIIKNDFARFLISMISHEMPQEHEFLTASVHQLTKDKTVISGLESKLDDIANVVKGKPSPQFTNYINHAGGTNALKDYRGKYVYIDLWATWCGPCIDEITYLKKLEKKFEGKNIHFLSISTDTDTDAWRKMVTEKNLGGVQLIADKPDSDFITKYQVTGIPRFILIDPEGIIVHPDMLRPSQEKEIVAYFKDLGI
ncbi:MAG: Thiol:disulfide interchange protein TlpA [Formosa sp. Hel3_A1_48]|nr:MAG: Thiol:disulfide interchange protein TlpA [Formosa sp. Hel3_A1_48]